MAERQQNLGKSPKRPDNFNYRYLLLLIAITAGAVNICNSTNPDMASEFERYITSVFSGSATGDRYVLTPTATVIAEAQRPPSLSSYSELLTPRSVRAGAEIFTYPEGAIINLTQGVNLFLDVDTFNRINKDSRYGVNLNSEEQNFTYLFPQSFTDDNGREEAIRMVEDEFPLVLSVFNNQQAISRERARYSIVSVADVLKNLSKNNPDIPVQSDLFRQGSAAELTSYYLALSRLQIRDPKQTPLIYPVTPQARALLSQGDYSLRLMSINPNYKLAIGLAVSQ